jgi:hypothetical protein
VAGDRRGPGAVEQRAARVGGAGRGERAVAARVARGVCCGRAAAIPPPRAGRIDPCAVPPCGHAGDRAGALDAAAGVERVHDGTKAPGVPLVVACWRQPSKPCAGRRHRPDVGVDDHGLGGRGADERTAPAPVGWAPGGPAGVAEVVAPANRLEARRGRLAIPPGLCAGPASSAEGCGLDLGAIDRRASARAPQAGHWDGVTTGGGDPSAGRLGDQRGRHDPADVALLGELTGAPSPPRPRFLDQDQRCACGRHGPDPLVEIALARAEGAAGDDRGVVCCSDGGDSAALVMAIPSDVERASVVHG